MNLMRLSAGLLAVAVLTACIPSLQPLYTKSDLVYDPALAASFSEKPEDTPVWTFTKAGDDEYRLVIKDGAKSSPFAAHLFKLGNDLYLDLFPDAEGLEGREDFFKSALVPGHIFFRVTEIKPALKFHALQEDWVKQHLLKHKDAVPHTFANDRLVFTGSTEQMQTFLKSLSGEKEAWSDPAVLARR